MCGKYNYVLLFISCEITPIFTQENPKLSAVAYIIKYIYTVPYVTGDLRKFFHYCYISVVRNESKNI